MVTTVEVIRPTNGGDLTRHAYQTRAAESQNQINVLVETEGFIYVT